MTHRIDVAQGRDLAARWCVLAEQRLEYLTELFETGRWRRFHSERGFLENIQEAKTAVETWRGLAMHEASRQNSVAVSWQGHNGVTPPRGDSGNQAYRPSRQPAEIAVQAPLAPDISMIAEAEDFSEEALPAQDAHALAVELAMDIDAIEQRYPLLRNAL